MTEPWLGHRDLCCSQWRKGWCDCADPNNPVEIPEAIAEDNQI